MKKMKKKAIIDKEYCVACGRGQLLDLMGNKMKLSRYKYMPKFLKSKIFRYGFLIFFVTMFLNMVLNTYLVFKGTNDLKEVLTILWTFKMPWNYNEAFIQA